MDYCGLDQCLQGLFGQYVPLSPSQTVRLARVTSAVLLAGTSTLRKIARQVPGDTQQDSRVKWLCRTFQANYVSQAYVYRPLLQQALAGYHAKTMHVVLDRTTPADPSIDLLSANLAYRGRALPLAWEFMRHGRSCYEQHQQLISACYALLPRDRKVIVYGDSEFGEVPLMRYVRSLGWQFILGIGSNYNYRHAEQKQWKVLAQLPVTRHRAIYIQNVVLTQTHQYDPVNIFAFYHPRYANRRRRADIRYCATSLPTTRQLRRLGRRRWSIECCFKDFKSSGWELNRSLMQRLPRREGLHVILSVAYLWATCLGRWLCKRGQRSQIDSHPTRRQLSLFRIGWDYIVNNFRNARPCPMFLTLYE